MKPYLDSLLWSLIAALLVWPTSLIAIEIGPITTPDGTIAEEKPEPRAPLLADPIYIKDPDLIVDSYIEKYNLDIEVANYKQWINSSSSIRRRNAEKYNACKISRETLYNPPGIKFKIEVKAMVKASNYKVVNNREFPAHIDSFRWSVIPLPDQPTKALQGNFYTTFEIPKSSQPLSRDFKSNSDYSMESQEAREMGYNLIKDSLRYVDGKIVSVSEFFHVDKRGQSTGQKSCKIVKVTIDSNLQAIEKVEFSNVAPIPKDGDCLKTQGEQKLVCSNDLS